MSPRVDKHDMTFIATQLCRYCASVILLYRHENISFDPFMRCTTLSWQVNISDALFWMS